METRSRTGWRRVAGLLLVAVCALGAAPLGAQDDGELEALLAEERGEADRLRRSGEFRAAGRILREHLAEDSEDYRSLFISARCDFDRDRVPEAQKKATRAFDLAERAGDAGLFAAAARLRIEYHLELGQVDRALEVLDRAGAALNPIADPRSAWWVSRALLANGQHEAARTAWVAGARAEAEGDWTRLLARGRCERASGWYERASATLVLADKAARQVQGRGAADVHVELGGLFFEVYREVESPSGDRHLVAEEYLEALRLNPVHEGALLGQLELYRYNWRLKRRSAGEVIGELLALHPMSVDVHLAAASGALDDGQLPRAQFHLNQLEELAPRRREVRSELAALAWVQHRRELAEELLAELKREDPRDGRPNREIGRHLCELYRFAEAVPFLEESVELNAGDPVAWTQLGRALANTGLEEQALEAFYRAKEVSGGRLDGWRKNMRLVLERIRDECVVSDYGELSFVWRPDAKAVLEVYLPEFYDAAREDLARRYGYTPDHVRIEIFREHQDFSTRSTGFEGFPATGVCFGPVVTALSPLSEMRGAFSWARTSFHEFSHVIHLGLSHNRCPRWITEGLATWEELQRDVSWTRNMRRDLLDARANDYIIPVRELNQAFRGPRILFGYYQGGLLCEMLIQEHGFAPMVRLLEAFDRGLDLDQAFDEVYDSTPEEVDADFLSFVDEKLGGLKLEPRWQPARIAALRLLLTDRTPEDQAERALWLDRWTTIAWASWQAHKRIDAEEALRMIARLEPTSRTQFLRAEIAFSMGEEREAQQFILQGLELGGDDYRARVALGMLALRAEDQDEALLQFSAAETAFPGYPDSSLSAERSQWELHELRGETNKAMAARERWLAWNASDVEQRIIVARWLAKNERFGQSARRYREVNDVDPFRRSLHRAWGRVLARGGRHEEALREFGVALLVPAGLDADLGRYRQAPVTSAEMAAAESRVDRKLGEEPRARQLDGLLGLDSTAVEERAQDRNKIRGWMAASLLELSRAEEARELAQRVLESNPENAAARRVLERLDGAH